MERHAFLQHRSHVRVSQPEKSHERVQFYFRGVAAWPVGFGHINEVDLRRAGLVLTEMGDRSTHTGYLCLDRRNDWPCLLLWTKR